MEPQAARVQLGAANEDTGHPPLILAPFSLVGSCKNGPMWTFPNVFFSPSIALEEMLCLWQ